MAKTTLVEKQTAETGTKIATEAVTNIRTVASLSTLQIMLHLMLLLLINL